MISLISARLKRNEFYMSKSIVKNFFHTHSNYREIRIGNDKKILGKKKSFPHELSKVKKYFF